MALPVSINLAYFPSTGSGNLGPFIDGSGNVYVIACYNSGGTDAVAVWKATDPTSSFTSQDAIFPTTCEYADAYFDGTYIHLYCSGIVSSARYNWYARFDTSTDQFVDASNFGGSSGTEYYAVYSHTDAPTTYWGGITSRETRGSELLTNGTFASDITSWTTSGTSGVWSWSSNNSGCLAGTYTGATTGANIYQGFTAVANQQYEIKFTIHNLTITGTGSLEIGCGPDFANPNVFVRTFTSNISSSQSFTVRGNNDANESVFVWARIINAASGDTTTVELDDFSVKTAPSIIIVHPGENPATMGGTYQEVAYSRLDTGWTTGVVVASTAAKNDNYLYAYPVMGSSDQCHFGYVRDTNADFYLRALSSGNALRTQRTLAGSFTQIKGGRVFTRSSTERIAFCASDTDANNGFDRIYFDHFTDDSSPTISTDVIQTTLSSGTARPFTTAFNVDENDTNDKNYQAHIDSTAVYIYLKSDGGGTTWGFENSSTAIRTGTALAGLSSNIYSRGGNRLYAFVYDDNGTVKYDEFTLYSESTSIVPSAIASGATVYQPTLVSQQTVVPNAIASGETVYNVTLAAGAVSIVPTAIASAETVHEPTLVQGAATIVPGAIASTETVYNVTLAPGAVSIVPEAIASAETVYDPTLIAGAATIVPNAIASAETVHNPTLAPGAATIVPNAIASAETVYQPTVTQTGGVQNVLPNHIASTETVYNVTLTATFTVLPDTINSAETVHEPTLAAGAVTIVPNAIASAETVYDPTLFAGAATIVPNAITSAETVHEPTLAAIATILPNTIASAETVHEPTLVADQFILPNTIGSAETVHEPILSTGASFIVPNAIASAETVYDVTLTAGSVTIVPNHIASSEAVYQPTLLAGAVTITPNAIASGETVYNVTLTAGSVTILPGAIASAETVHEPTLTPGAATIVPNAIASAETVHEPVVASGQIFIVPNAIASAETVYDPTLVAGAATILPDHIASAETVHEPILASGQTFIVPDHIASAETVHEPTLVPLAVSILVDTIASSEIVYDPTVSLVSSPQTIEPDNINSGETVHNPTILGGVQQQPSAGGGGGAAIAPFIRWGRKKKKKKESEVKEVASAVMQAVRQVERVAEKEPEIAKQVYIPPQIDYSAIAERILEQEKLNKLRQQTFKAFLKRVERAVYELDDEAFITQAVEEQSAELAQAIRDLGQLFQLRFQGKRQ